MKAITFINEGCYRESFRAFQKLKDWARACGADRVTPWDCLPPTNRASLRWDHLNKAFREPKNRHPDWEEGMEWNHCHGHWEHPPNAIVAETEALVSSLDTAVWESIGQCHHITDAAHVKNLPNNNDEQFYDFEDIGSRSTTVLSLRNGNHSVV